MSKFDILTDDNIGCHEQETISVNEIESETFVRFRKRVRISAQDGEFEMVNCRW